MRNINKTPFFRHKKKFRSVWIPPGVASFDHCTEAD